MQPTMLLLLFLPLLCLAHNVDSRPPPPACPQHICVCSPEEGPKTKQPPQREANCTELPAERLTETITALRVSGQVTKVTRRMIAALGGNLVSLDLSGCEIESLEAGLFDAAPKLAILRLSDNRIEEIGPGMFSKNNALRELRLDGNRLKRVDEAAFSKLEHLRELHLERNYLSRFPSKIPMGLSVLNVSHNNLGPDLGCELHETNLKELNLCGNHLERLTNTTLHALNKLQSLCVGDGALHLPKNAAAYLPHLSDISLVASTESRARLDAATQHELAGMGTLTSLAIVNYRLESLSFLHSLTKLRHLTLRDITIQEPVDFQSILLSKTSLTVLDLGDSHELVHSLLDKMQVLGTLSGLETVSFRNTGLTHLAPSDVPHSDRVRLDLSANPLRCDCGFVWLKNGPMHLLANADETRCATPGDREGRRLLDIVHAMECPTEQYREVRDYANIGEGRPVGRPNGRPLSFPNNKHDLHNYQPNRGTWSRPPVKFPNHHEQGGESEFPTHPHQGGESEFPNHHEQGGESEFPNHHEQGGESEFPTHPEQGGESEVPPQPDQGGEIEFPTNTESGGGEMEVFGNSDETEAGTTTGPTATSQSGTDTSATDEGEGTDRESPTSDPVDGTPEHMSVHDADVATDDYGIVYIMLGSLLGLLTLVGLILGAFYWHFKRTGGNKVTPGSGMPSTTDATPVEPTYQQLQHTEGSSLLKNAKK